MTILTIGNDNDIYINDLYYAGSPLNSATVTWNLYLADGVTAVSGASLTLTKVSGVDGAYLAVLESSVTDTLTPNGSYVAKWTVSESGKDASWRNPVKAVYRTF
jgi:hypothetical protein